VKDREEFIDDIPYPETQNYVKTARHGGGLSAAVRIELVGSQ
jgi:hypothetical protein